MPGPAACDGDFFARFTQTGGTAMDLTQLLNPLEEPDESDLAEAEWGVPGEATFFNLQLPRDVEAGAVYTEADADLILFYTQGGTNYTLLSGTSATVTVTTWDGPGGVAEGTFSAALRPAGSSSLLELTDGTFRAPIVRAP